MADETIEEKMKNTMQEVFKYYPLLYEMNSKHPLLKYIDKTDYMDVNKLANNYNIEMVAGKGQHALTLTEMVLSHYVDDLKKACGVKIN